MVPGRATSEGTRRYRERFEDAAEGHFRDAGSLTLSGIGLGTYLGDPDDATDRGYAEALASALRSGCNVVDSAVNYRCQRSERTVGAALANAVDDGLVQRDEVLVSTKGGYVPFDGSPPEDPAGYFRETFVEPGVMEPEELVAGCHCMTPRYLDDQLERSRRNLGLETIDLYYVHNPETQLREVPAETVYERLGEAFGFLEEAADEGRIAAYGVATWGAFRVAPEDRDHLSLERTLRVAREAGGEDHRLRAVQLPFSVGLPEAALAATQGVGDSRLPAMVAAGELGLAAFASASISQGNLLGRLPGWLRERLGPELTDAQRCLQFSRSGPGVTAALVGTSDPEHARENLGLATMPPLDPERVVAALERPDASAPATA